MEAANDLGYTAGDYNGARPPREGYEAPARPREVRWWVPVVLAAVASAAYAYAGLAILRAI